MFAERRFYVRERKDGSIKLFSSKEKDRIIDIEGIKIVDSEGNDLTSAKVKKIQKDKGLHRP